MKFFYTPICSSERRGFSIFELMIAITISLIVLVVMMQAFKRASGEIKKGRSMIAMASEMRAVGETFRRDLASLTVSPRVWNLTAECNGYFEIVEGTQNDATYTANPEMTFFGDIDDVIAMTVRSDEKPFRGRWVDAGGVTQIVESNVAEVIWFVVHTNLDDANIALGTAVDMGDYVTLYRRVLLVLPDEDPSAPPPPPQRPRRPLSVASSSVADMNDFFRNNDISVRPNPNIGQPPIVNSLSDLTLRQNRYAHNSAAFPFELQRNLLADTTNPAPVPSLDRRIPTGEDIILTNVAGFDLRVYSPDAPIQTTTNDEHFSGPGDPRFGGVGVPEGAYVDLGWGGTGWFGIPPPNFATPTWCSWSPQYFQNSLATNGLDDTIPPNGIVDEESELLLNSNNFFPPYPHPVRAVQLTMRGIEKSTRNIRQVSIISSFVPE